MPLSVIVLLLTPGSWSKELAQDFSVLPHYVSYEPEWAVIDRPVPIDVLLKIKQTCRISA